MNNSQFTWSSEWIQEYESSWGILEKFKFANAIDSNTVLEIIGNDDVKKLRYIANAGYIHRSLISFSGIDSNVTEKMLGINLKVYQNSMVEKIISIIPQIKYVSKYIRRDIYYCPICLSKGYHSFFHQINFIDHCPFHPDQKLLDRCIVCHKKMPEYLINKGKMEAYHCVCGHCFLESENIKLLMCSWKTNLKIQSELIKSWLKLPHEKIDKYNLVYPFDNYNKYFELSGIATEYLAQMPKFILRIFNNNDLVNNEIIKNSSKKGIFNIKNDYVQLKENYIEAYNYGFTSSEFKEKYVADSIYYEIYKQSRTIYKAITRYILRKIIKKHNNCVKIFNKAHQNGDVCPFAMAFILWKMECENKSDFWQIDSYRSISQSFDFKFLSGEFSIFPFGSYMSHLDYILNRDREFNLIECNVSSKNYIVNKIISFLLIERFIKWLEVVLDPKKYKRIYPDDNIPMYIATIPHNMDGEISFYFQKNRYAYMKKILNEINEKFICPYKRSTMYPRFRTPMQIAMDRIDKLNKSD